MNGHSFLVIQGDWTAGFLNCFFLASGIDTVSQRVVSDLNHSDRPGTSRSRMVNYDGSLINFSWYKCILISDSPGKCLPVRIICLNLWDFLQSFSRGKGLCLLRRLWLQPCFIVGQQETCPRDLSLWWEESERSDSTGVQWVCHQMFTWVRA